MILPYSFLELFAQICSIHELLFREQQVYLRQYSRQ